MNSTPLQAHLQFVNCNKFQGDEWIRFALAGGGLVRSAC
jgi:hypothetical protein